MSQPTDEKIDLSRFQDTFFQESLEGLTVMERGLLALSEAVGDGGNPEIIHDVFRAAHSIKGGCGTFGFVEITELTHLLETILDLIREGMCPANGPANEVLLRSVDCVRELISARLESRIADPTMVSIATAELTALLEASRKGGFEPRKTPASAAISKQPDVPQPDLDISFRPHKTIFLSANDPVHYLMELGRLGDVNSRIDLSRLPELEKLETTDSYLGWDLTLCNNHATIQEIRELFSWVEGRCELEISPITSKKEGPQQAISDQGQKATTPRPSRDFSTIRVSTDKVDSVVNLVGELVITQSMLTCIGEDFQPSHLTKLREGLAQLTRNTRELQETVLKMRMLPVSNLFDRFPRLVHDLSRKLNKSVSLKVSGEMTELDRNVLEKLSDPLVHLVRNSLDHGIECAEARRITGKPEQGLLKLHAEHKGGSIIIEISDDGAGLNSRKILERAVERGIVQKSDQLDESQIYALIFEPGFSTAEQITDLSGRGVGLDVVRRNVQELGGRVHISSQFGFGTTTTIQLPLTLAILDGQLMRLGNHRFVVPLVSIIESVQVKRESLHPIADGVNLYSWRNEYLRVIQLDRLFNLWRDDTQEKEKDLLIVVESRGERVALSVDDLLAQQQVVIKSLDANFQKVNGIAGATILGDGDVAMILEIAEIVETSKGQAVGR